MADDQEKRKRPPYASVNDLEGFFQRMSNMQEPAKVDSEWVASYNLATAQPQAIVSVLKWLKIVDNQGASLGVWDDVRIPASRQQKLAELVRAAYADIFDKIDDISQASMDDLKGAFIQAYKGGDPRRVITCFLGLCNLAGIATASTVKKRQSSSNAKVPAARPASKPKPAAAPPKKHGKPQSERPSVSVNFTMEVPADWTEEQIRQRYEAILHATSGDPQDGA